MKHRGILHAELSRLVAALGHGDLLVIGDAGLPVPHGVGVIDLALRPGVPGLLETLATVLEELPVEAGVIAEEFPGASPTTHAALLAAWPADAALRKVPHEELKRLSERAHAIVRTGEFTPYANVVLVAGVAF